MPKQTLNVSLSFELTRKFFQLYFIKLKRYVHNNYKLFYINNNYKLKYNYLFLNFYSISKSYI